MELIILRCELGKKKLKMQSTYEKSEPFPDISKLNLFLKILRQEGLETKFNICFFNFFFLNTTPIY